ncbi:MAG: hypothetical protein PHE27_00485 [Alphaproteobacteria bacterium]|nr:hypothetical protein [Alphaproteobacteria bacterium]
MTPQKLVGDLRTTYARYNEYPDRPWNRAYRNDLVLLFEEIPQKVRNENLCSPELIETISGIGIESAGFGPLCVLAGETLAEIFQTHPQGADNAMDVFVSALDAGSAEARSPALELIGAVAGEVPEAATPGLMERIVVRTLTDGAKIFRADKTFRPEFFDPSLDRCGQASALCSPTAYNEFSAQLFETRGVMEKLFALNSDLQKHAFDVLNGAKKEVFGVPGTLETFIFREVFCILFDAAERVQPPVIPAKFSYGNNFRKYQF